MSLLQKYLRISLLFIIILFGVQTKAYNSINYNAKNGIVSNAVRKVFIDNTDRVWIGTDNGVSCITGNGIVNYNYSQGLNCDKVWNFAQTSDGRLWLAGYGKGLYEFKNDQFIQHQLPRSKANNAISRMIEHKGLLFIGSEAGLNAMDLKSNQFYWFKNNCSPDSFQVHGYFKHKDQLYMHTFFHGTYKVNLESKTLDLVRNEDYIHKWNYSIYQYKDSIFLHRTKFNKNLTHNLFSSKTADYIQGAPMDSLETSTVIWKMEQSPIGMLAACWGVRDDSGGIYLRSGKKMISANALFGLTSTKVRDLTYSSKQNKLYVATLDQGLFIYDFNKVVSKESQFSSADILDLKVVNGKIYVLKKDTLSVYKNGQLEKSVSIDKIKKWILKTKPNIALTDVVLDAPWRMRDLSVSSNNIVVNGNFAEVRFNLSLDFIDYIKTGSDAQLCFMKNDDVLIFRDFGNSELCENFGKGKHITYNHWEENKTNPRDITEFCRLNDTTFLLGSENSRIYVYKQHEYVYKRFAQLGEVNLPTINDRLSENTFVSVDRSNILYKGVYTQDSLILNKIVDLKTFGVIESYFVKAFEDLIIVSTNKGIYIVAENNTYLVDKTFGLSENLVIRTAQYLNGKIYLATSEGVLSIDIAKLKSIQVEYKLTHLSIESNNKIAAFETGDYLVFNKKPLQINIRWEINSHPYSKKLKYSYRTQNNSEWLPLNSLGEIIFNEPAFGVKSIELQIYNETNGSVRVVNLITLEIKKPIYLQDWFLILIGILFVTVILFFSYRKRIEKLRLKAHKAEKETLDLKLRLDTLQFLLKPHFIFNALSSIQNLMLKQEIDKSLEYSGYFSKFLRGIMQNSGEELVSLKTELDNTMRYIELEKLRFNEDIVVLINVNNNIDPENIKIIPFLFQPLVENIFKHAFSKDTLNPRIEITVNLKEDIIEYKILDNGIGLKGKTLESILANTQSKGIKIIIAQLEKFLPQKHKISLSENPTGGLCWTINTVL